MRRTLSAAFPKALLLGFLSGVASPAAAFAPAALRLAKIASVAPSSGGRAVSGLKAPRAVAFPAWPRPARSFGIFASAGEENAEAADPRFDQWYNKSEQNMNNLEAAFKAAPSFLDGAILRYKDGSKVAVEDFKGRSVAIFYAAEWCPACRDFLPQLNAFVEAHNSAIEDTSISAKGRPPLGLVFVSSDANEEAALAHFQKMGSEFSRQGEWCMVDYNSGMRQELKRLYGVWAGREKDVFGQSIDGMRARRGGVPALVVVERDGEPLAHLNAEADGLMALISWRPDDYKWP